MANTRKINKKFMRKWVDALVSRKYKQCEGQLRNTYDDKVGYCCLGVAADLLYPDNWLGDYHTVADGECMLSKKILDEIGIDRDEQENLSEMNDSGKKFYQIARYLRRKYL